MKAAGISRDFSYEECYAKIPLFWQEDRGDISGMFGVCIDRDDGIHYMIADLYKPWDESIGEAFTFSAGLWTVFPVTGKLPEALQSVNIQVWQEWMPGKGKYKMQANYSIEM